MFDILSIKENNQFSWNLIGNIGDGRKNLGESMPVFIYRLVFFTMRAEFIKQLGKEKAIEIFKNAGEVAGREFTSNMLDVNLPFNDFIHMLQEVLVQTKLGILRVEEFDLETGRAVLTIAEDLDCSGTPISGETMCNYAEGFLEGILGKYTNKKYIVKEVDCWGMGATVCRFEANIDK